MSGTEQGSIVVLPYLPEVLEPFETKPQARKLIEADGANLVVLSFKAGQKWSQHHSIHPIIVQVLSGSVDFEVKGRTLRLKPGSPIHLTAHLLHEVRAVEDATLMVTMLTGEEHRPAKLNLQDIEVF